jgi:hypothetical protein
MDLIVYQAGKNMKTTTIQNFFLRTSRDRRCNLFDPAISDPEV